MFGESCSGTSKYLYGVMAVAVVACRGVTSTKEPSTNTKYNKLNHKLLYNSIQYSHPIFHSLLLSGINLLSLNSVFTKNPQNLPSRDFLSQYPPLQRHPPPPSQILTVQSSASPSQGKRSYTCTRYRYHVVWPVIYSISKYKLYPYCSSACRHKHKYPEIDAKRGPR
ncbi:hypothetical protein HDV62DRAFT_63159 [Trichoderma sp. SZMC 28011]